jgi:deoxyribose-phosphate aldolase
MYWMRGIKGLNKTIDHTLLKPTAQTSDIVTLCEEARQYSFKSVCIEPVHVVTAKQALRGSDVLVCTVIGFPLGTNVTSTKVAETRQALLDGADEFDMVIHVGDALEGHFERIEQDIYAVVQAAASHTVKVILETCYLNETQIIEACLAAKRAGAHFVKTSTGFGTAGATVEHVQLMKQTVGDSMHVKASGGIRSATDAQAMLEAGATRLGTSAGIAIVTGVTSKASY